MNTSDRRLFNDRRKKKGIVDVWKDGFVGKVVIAIVVLLLGSLISWIAWSSISIAKVSTIFVTKQEAVKLEERCQDARNRLESRTCEKIDKVENKVLKNEERWEKVQKELKTISNGVSEIKGEIHRQGRRTNHD